VISGGFSSSKVVVIETWDVVLILIVNFPVLAPTIVSEVEELCLRLLVLVVS
jgi:hypothetical protein